MTNTEPTDEMVQAFKDAWESEGRRIGRGIAAPGVKTKAGLRAVLALVRDPSA